MKLDLQERSEKWWYRSLQVIFSIALIVAALSVIFVAFSTFPKLSKYKSTYQIVCNENGVKRGEFPYNTLSYSTGDFESFHLRASAQIACHNQNLSGDEISQIYNEIRAKRLEYVPVAQRIDYVNHIPSESNYEIEVKKQGYTDTGLSMFLKTLSALILAFLPIFIVRSIVLYVLFKDPVQRTLDPRNLYFFLKKTFGGNNS
tara:strand:+ start:3590 stop:4195 length:606 start_codon:yes stop_codon:yes gene_type:complete